jgi:predicted HTH domain antitoxin
LAEETRTLPAFHLFASGRLSAGKAARLAGLPRVHFLFKATRRGIDWLPYSDEDLRREVVEHHIAA